MKLITLFLSCIAALVQGCSHDETDTTDIEGTWSSICVQGFPEEGFGLFETTSHKVITTYRGTSIKTQVEAYTDTNCANPDTTLDTNESDIFVNPDNTPVSFIIGKPTSSANGVAVREIDFVTENNQILPDIYLLQDNKNTLYFGIPCFISSTTCSGNRPAEIMYDFPYSRVQTHNRPGSS